MHPAYAHVAYNPPIGILPTILMCVGLTIMFYALMKPDTEQEKQRRIRRLNTLATVRAKANWKGNPPDGLKRQEVLDRIKVVPIATEIVPTHCPNCGLCLKSYKSDFDTDTGEFRVTGKYCLKEDWTYLTWRPTNLDRRLP